MIDVPKWLADIGLARYAGLFKDNAIGGDVLADLTDADLKDLGLPLGDRKRLLKAIAALAGAAAPSPAAKAATEAMDEAAGEGERRQVTVMFADLVGFTRLSQSADAEEVHDVLERFFAMADAAVTELGGSVDKHIGDCVMAVFGAPVAHGDDPERAARAALAIHAAAPELGGGERQLQVHIGIASGEVVASATGSAAHRAYTVTGEAVNLAARLADRADPGETLLAAATAQAVAERFIAAPLGDARLDGIAAPVQVYRLDRPRDAAALRPIIGRRAELAQIDGALAAAREQGRGVTLQVRGEVGIGKTRLVEEASRRAAAGGFRVHRGLVLDFGAGRGQDAIRALARGLLDLGGEAGDADRQAAADRAVAAGLVAADQQMHLADLLDLPQAPATRALYDAMDKPARDEGGRATFCALVRRATVAAPLFLVVEDVHWADAGTLAHLAALAATVADCRALLVLTSRVEGDPIDAAWRARAAAPLLTIDLAPLHRDEAMQLASGLVHAAQEVAASCVERSGGNPLFLEQLLRNSAEAVGEELPGSIRSIVLARTDRLPASDRRALQAASVLGQRATLAQIRALLDDPGYSCEPLIERHLLRPDGEALLFAHALICDGVYASLLRARRRELHGRAAAWFETRDPALFAEHLDRAGDTRAPAAYLAAATQEAGRYRDERARQLVARGQEVADARDDRFRLTAFHGELLLGLGAGAASLPMFAAALDLAADAAERSRVLYGLASAKRVVERLDEALDDLAAAQAAAERAGLLVDQARIHHLRGNILFPRGDLDGCTRAHDAAYRLAQAAGSAEEEARALGGLGDAAYARGQLSSAYEYFAQCCALAERHGFRRIEAANRSMLAFPRFAAMDFDGALADAEAAVDLAVRVGHHRAEIVGHHGAVIVHLRRGDADRARAAIAAAEAQSARIGARRFTSENMWFEAEAELLVGNQVRARQLAQAAIALSRETGLTYCGGCILGMVALTANDAAERDAALAEAETVVAAGALSHNAFFFREYAIEAGLRFGDWDLAERQATLLEAVTRQEPMAWTDFLIARGRALAAHGRGRRDAALRDELARLAALAARHGLRPMRGGLQSALADCGAAPSAATARDRAPEPGNSC